MLGALGHPKQGLRDPRILDSWKLGELQFDFLRTDILDQLIAFISNFARASVTVSMKARVYAEVIDPTRQVCLVRDTSLLLPSDFFEGLSIL